ELVRVTRTGSLPRPPVVRVVPIEYGVVLHTRRARSGDDRLEGADLAGLEGAGDPSGEGQLVERVDPVRRVVELPVGVGVGLLERVPGAHAELDRHHVGLLVRKMIGRAGEAHVVPVHGEDRARDVVTAPVRRSAAASAGRIVPNWA